jgi:hypothetical protein
VQEIRRLKQSATELYALQQQLKSDFVEQGRDPHDTHATSQGPIRPNDIDFIRSCLSRGNLCEAERLKALGILSLMQRESGGEEGSLPAQLKHLLGEATSNLERNGASTNVDANMMQGIFKSVTKTQAMMKFERMQRDSDRLSRIEDLLSKSGREHTHTLHPQSADGFEALKARVEQLAETVEQLAEETATQDQISKIQLCMDDISCELFDGWGGNNIHSMRDRIEKLESAANGTNAAENHLVPCWQTSE